MRARWLKPEFFTDKKIGPLGMAAGLVFEALWCIADDGGVAQCDAILLKGQLLMRWDELTIPVIETALAKLTEAGRVQHYVIGDRDYYLIHSWRKNQSVHNPSQFRHPRPPQQVAASNGDTLQQDGGSTDAGGSPSSHPIYLDSSTPQHPDSSTPVTPSRARANGDTDELRKQFKVILEAYPKRAGGDSARDGYLAFLERIRAGATPAEILEGVRRYAAYCETTDKIGTEFVKQLRTFLGKSRYYLEPWNPPRAAGAHSQSRRNAGEESYARGRRALEDIPR